MNHATFETFEKTDRYKQACAESIKSYESIPDHLRCEGDPNHPMYQNTLFGYVEKEFLAKQYK